MIGIDSLVKNYHNLVYVIGQYLHIPSPSFSKTSLNTAADPSAIDEDDVSTLVNTMVAENKQ